MSNDGLVALFTCWILDGVSLASVLLQIYVKLRDFNVKVLLILSFSWLWMVD